MTSTKQKQFTAMIERACPGTIATLEAIAAKTRRPNILTNPVFPPVPTTQFDWAAVFEGYEPGQRVGYGRTKQAAIDDLIEQWEDDQ